MRSPKHTARGIIAGTAAKEKQFDCEDLFSVSPGFDRKGAKTIAKVESQRPIA